MKYGDLKPSLRMQFQSANCKKRVLFQRAHCIELMRSKKIDREGLISHEFPLDQAAEAFETSCTIENSIKVLINPEIVERKGSYLDRDGCLSVVEEEEVPIERPAYVKVRYKTLANREKILVAKDNDAALLEHEIDHLNGILTIDYILD